MSDCKFHNTKEDRYFEDYEVGCVYEFGSIAVNEAEIIEFARRFDPQTFHIDPEAAKTSAYGGLIASGWHTSALMMRLIVDNFLPSTASLALPASTSCAGQDRFAPATNSPYESRLWKPSARGRNPTGASSGPSSR